MPFSGKVRPMLQIHHAEDGPTPAKAYADACWQAEPRLSPCWWREALGHTVGRIGLDWRTQVHQAAHLASGSNLILTSPATHAQALSVIAATLPNPAAAVTCLVTPSLPSQPQATFVLWQPSVGADDAIPHLTQLESLVKSGAIEAYGLSLATLPQPSLGAWLQAATTAAEAAWGRKKRPALRVLQVPLCLTNLSALTETTETHKSEPVSLLELAARLGLMVIASPQVWPDDNQPPLAALQALTAAAQQEHNLNQTLGGWPHADDQPLFNILAHLSQGRAPWPTPAHWHNWLVHVYPQLMQVWQGQYAAQAQAYVNALQALLPYGEVLARGAAQPVWQQVFAVVQSRLTQPWSNLQPAEAALAMLTSIPSVTCVAVAAPCHAAALRTVADIPDIGAVLLG